MFASSRRRLLALALPLALLAVAPPPAAAQEGASEVDAALDRLGANLRVEVLAPAHVAFAEASDLLATAVEVYCAAPDDEALADARAAFHAAADRWMEVQWVNFGPQTFLMRKTRIQFWPDTRNVVGRQLSAALADERGGLLDPATLAEASVALQGFPALERLLFADTRIAEGPYACSLAGAISRNMATMAQQLAVAWNDPAEAGLPLPEGAELAAEAYGAVAEQLTATVDRKLVPVAGESPADVRPRLAESWRSGRSLANIRHNIAGLSAVIGGSADDLRFAGVLRGAAAAPALADALTETLGRARDLAEALAGTPMMEAAAEGPARQDLEALTAALSELNRLWQGPVGDALGLRVGFNSLDGD
jgi:hypothetical protein